MSGDELKGRQGQKALLAAQLVDTRALAAALRWSEE